MRLRKVVTELTESTCLDADRTPDQERGANAQITAIRKIEGSDGSEIVRCEPGMLCDSAEHLRPDFVFVVKCPSEIWPSFPFELDVRAALSVLNSPPNAQESTEDPTSFSAGPRTHRKRIDLGGFFTCSVRSARTRKASAVTLTSASCFVSPYAITQGRSGISAIQRPSSSWSNSILKDSPPSGIRGTVATVVTVVSQFWEMGCPNSVGVEFGSRRDCAGQSRPRSIVFF